MVGHYCAPPEPLAVITHVAKPLKVLRFRTLARLYVEDSLLGGLPHNHHFRGHGGEMASTEVEGCITRAVQPPVSLAPWWIRVVSMVSTRVMFGPRVARRGAHSDMPPSGGLKRARQASASAAFYGTL